MNVAVSGPATSRSTTGNCLRVAIPLALLCMPLTSGAADPSSLGLQKLGEGRMSFFGISGETQPGH